MKFVEAWSHSINVQGIGKIRQCSHTALKLKLSGELAPTHNDSIKKLLFLESSLQQFKNPVLELTNMFNGSKSLLRKFNNYDTLNRCIIQ